MPAVVSSDAAAFFRSAASKTGGRSAIFLLTSCSSTSKSQRRDIARADAALPQGLALLAERSASIGAQLSSWRSSAMAGAALLRAARWFKRLRSLSCRSCARFSISFQFRMSTSSAGTCQRAHRQSAAPARALPEGGSSSCRRLTSSRVQRLGINGGLQQPQLLAALQDVGGHSEFFSQERNPCRLGAA